MAKTPTYSVFVQETGADISKHISRLSYSEAVDIDNLLTIEIQNNQPQFFERLGITEGVTLSFQYGYIRGDISNTHLARVVDVSSNYTGIISTIIMATDLGVSLKKNTSKKIWENVKSTDIVKEIAQIYGLVAITDDTTTNHKLITQSGRTDYELLKHLADIESNGSYRFFLRDDEIHFTKRDLKEESIKTFIYGDGNGKIKSFKPSSRETSKLSSGRNTVVNSVDPFTNEVVQESIDSDSSEEETKLGDYDFSFNEQSDYKGRVAPKPSEVQKQKDDPNRSGKSLDIPVASKEEAKNIANKEKKDSAMNDITATLSVIGSPNYYSDKIITMGGVQKRDEGNWYTKRTTHTIQKGDSYDTRMSLQKNAIAVPIAQDNNKSIDSKNIDTNTTPGPPSINKKKEVSELYTYDGQSNQTKIDN